MKRGCHQITGSFSEAHSPLSPRKYILDNGDYELNMMIESVEIIPTNNQATQPDIGNQSLFFVVATSEAGAIPVNTFTLGETTAYSMRMNDSRQIAWGFICTGNNIETILTPDRIIPGDIYVNAWSVAADGSLGQLTFEVGYLITMKQVKNTGAQGLLEAVVEYSQEN